MTSGSAAAQSQRDWLVSRARPTPTRDAWRESTRFYLRAARWHRPCALRLQARVVILVVRYNYHHLSWPVTSDPPAEPEPTMATTEPGEEFGTTPEFMFVSSSGASSISIVFLAARL